MGNFAAAPSPSAVTQAPLPPLPDLQSSPGGAPPEQGGILAALMSGIGPVKSSVDQIQAACKQVVQSGAVPGGEQICAQIVALASSLLPMAAQNAMQSTGAAPGGLTPPPAPPGGPQPIMQPAGGM